MDGLTTQVARGPARVRARAQLAISGVETRTFVIGVGLATYICGFLAGALVNLYLLAVHHPLVDQFRSTLSYGSAIIGDGFLLPVVNMIVASFIVRRRDDVTPGTVRFAVALGIAETAYFHVSQAVNGIVNWTMPTPWHWNILGLWHAMYMLAVTTWLWLFLLVVIKTTRRERAVPVEAAIVLLGVAAFFVLLRLDYIAVDLQTVLPHR
jgi:hypothetical protein